MIVIILAAGMAQRLNPLCVNKNKSLLKIGNKSLLSRLFQAYFNIGLRDFIVVTGHDADGVEKEIRRAQKGKSLKVTTIYNPFYKVRNNCQSLLLAIKDISEDILVSNADIIFDPNILKTIKGKTGNLLVIANKHKLDNETMKVVLKNNKVVNINKKADVKKSVGEYIGISIIRKKSIPTLKKSLQQIVAENPNCYYEDGYNLMLKKSPFYIADGNNFTAFEIDTLKDLNVVKKAFFSKSFGNN